MKKQIIPYKPGLNLNKKTISNLDIPVMAKIVGGARRTYSCEISDYCTRGRTCHQHIG